MVENEKWRDKSEPHRMHTGRSLYGDRANNIFVQILEIATTTFVFFLTFGNFQKSPKFGEFGNRNHSISGRKIMSGWEPGTTNPYDDPHLSRAQTLGNSDHILVLAQVL
jgi:hypothetical protein